MKIKKKIVFLGGGGVVKRGGGGQGGCEQRIEVFGKIHKKKIRVGEGGGSGGEGVRWAGRVGGGGVRMKN